MTCRRVCRELIELVQFGELDARSAPHLDHLAECWSCRDEIGINRMLVRHLRRALQARVDAAAPSPGAWSAILARTQLPERGMAAWFRARSVLLLARMRVATALSGTALAVLIASNTQVGIAPPDPSRFDAQPNAAGETFERQPLIPTARAVFLAESPAPVAYVRPTVTDPEAFMIGPFAPLQQRSSGDESETEEPAAEEAPLITFHHGSSDAPTPVDGPDDEGTADTGPTIRFIPRSQPLGEPS
jgi:hypothetical protein